MPLGIVALMLVQRYLPADQRGVIAGMLNLSRNLGLITGAAVMGTNFALATGAGDFATSSPQAVVTGMRVTFAVAAALTVVALVIALGSQAAARRDRRSDAWAGDGSRP